jgi:transcriptional regulator with XRE-family HTH domain
MNASSLIQLTLAAQNCTQRVLAQKLGVSPAQISKWKNGEHISREMEQRLRVLSNVGEIDPDLVSIAGSIEDARKWIALIRHIADVAECAAETGYNTAPLVEEISEDSYPLFLDTLQVLQEIGSEIPRPFPAELDLDFDDHDAATEAIWDDEVVSLIYAMFKAMTNVYGFYAAFVSDLVFDDELDLFDTLAWELNYDMLSLAASKLNPDEHKISGHGEFKRKVESDIRKKLVLVKERAIRAGIPLEAELLDLVYESHEALGHAAEGKSLGFTARRLHPDIYMNELLIGMRAIHQVLPAIMKKLGIYEEFQLEESELGLGRKS